MATIPAPVITSPVRIRPALRLRSARSIRVAQARLTANAVRARTGSRAIHRFIGRPNTPGVVTPCPSIMHPTATHPNAIHTGASRPSRAAKTAVTMATMNASAAIALTM